MSASTKPSTVTGEIGATGYAAEHMKQQIPVGLIIAAFLVGNIINPLYERTLRPLIGAWSSARNEHDSAFLAEFNTGLSGPDAMRQPYLIAYFSREYKLAEDTTKSVQNRCSVAQTILTYAQDPSIARHSDILYAMPASVADDIAYAKHQLAQPWYVRMFEHDPSCFVRIGKKIEQLKPGLLVADDANATVIAGGAVAPAPVIHHAHKTNVSSVVDQAVDTVAGTAAPSTATGASNTPGTTDSFGTSATTAADGSGGTDSAAPVQKPQPASAAKPGEFIPTLSGQAPLPLASAPSVKSGDWLYAPTFGNVVGNQMIKITLRKTALGRRAVLHNTTLTGERGRTVLVRLECIGCPPQIGLDEPRAVYVRPVASPGDRRSDQFIEIPTSLPITLRFHANEVST